jgi:hypothetical protein
MEHYAPNHGDSTKNTGDADFEKNTCKSKKENKLRQGQHKREEM